jgi:hypothetical protein
MKRILRMLGSEACRSLVTALSDEPSGQVLRSLFALFPPVDSSCSCEAEIYSVLIGPRSRFFSA